MKDLFIIKMYELSSRPYLKYFKKGQAWNVTTQALLKHPQGSLGLHLGEFLRKYHFQLQPKAEAHDVIHVLTNSGVSTKEEIAMQYYLLGNGKRSLYLWMVVCAGVLLYSSQLSYFRHQYRQGKQADKFYDLDFLSLLSLPLATVRQSYNIK